MKSRTDILQRISLVNEELLAFEAKYSVKNPRYNNFLRSLAWKAKKSVKDFQKALDFKVLLRQRKVFVLEECLKMSEAEVKVFLDTEKAEGALARNKWDKHSKPVFEAAIKAIRHVPSFVFDLKKRFPEFDVSLEFERESFNRLSFEIEKELEWVLNGE